MFDTLMSALGYVGDTLDKFGGRELRGALGGKPRELLSFVPFSDELGVTDPNDITTGRDLLHKAGVMDRSASGLGPALAGMGVEAALDPFTLLHGAKAVSRIGKGAENLSKLHGMIHVEKDPAVLARYAAERPGQLGFNHGLKAAAWGGPEIANEEINHALTNAASLTGDASGLPMQSRIAAGLQHSGLKNDSPLRLGLGNVMLESAGHTARKPGFGGVAEGGKFWLDPGNHQAYHNQFSRISPTAAAAYHAAPGAVAGGLAGAGAGIREDQEDPVRGALLGGLAGAAGGGLLSHAAYAPKKLSVPPQGAKDLLGYGGSNWLRKFLQDEGYDAVLHSPGTSYTPGSDDFVEIKNLSLADHPSFNELTLLDPKGKLNEFEPMDPSAFTKEDHPKFWHESVGQIPGASFFGENSAWDPRFRPYDSKELNEAADYLGPGYRPNRSFESAIGLRQGEDISEDIRKVLAGADPETISRIVQEIPEGSTRLGAGAESIALKTPGANPWAIRIAPEVSPIGFGDPFYRQNLPGVLQPIRSNVFPGEQGYGSGLIVEHLPLVNTFKNMGDARDGMDMLRAMGERDLGSELTTRAVDQNASVGVAAADLASKIQHLYGKPVDTLDLVGNHTNMSWVHGPNGPLAMTHDPGAAFDYGLKGEPGAVYPPPAPPTGDVLAALYSNGGDPSRDVRRMLEAGAMKGLEGQGLDIGSSLAPAVRDDARLRELLDQIARMYSTARR